MLKHLILLLTLAVNLQAQVDVLISKNHRGNTQDGAYRKGGIVEVRPAGMPYGATRQSGVYYTGHGGWNIHIPTCWMGITSQAGLWLWGCLQRGCYGSMSGIG